MKLTTGTADERARLYATAAMASLSASDCHVRDRDLANRCSFTSSAMVVDRNNELIYKTALGEDSKACVHVVFCQPVRLYNSVGTRLLPDGF